MRFLFGNDMMLLFLLFLSFYLPAKPRKAAGEMRAVLAQGMRDL